MLGELLAFAENNPALVTILLVAIGLPIALGMNRRGVEYTWRAFAERHNLIYRPPQDGSTSLSMTGQYSGRWTTLSATDEPERVTEVTIRLRYPTDGSFRLARQFLSDETFGASDVEIGDPGLDDYFLIQTDTPDFLRKLLQPGSHLRYELLGLRTPGYSIDLSRDELNYRQTGIETSAARLEYLFTLLNEMATLVEKIS
jgi:hypothetical protein